MPLTLPLFTSWLMIIIFFLGYAGIVFEHQWRINKAAWALLTAVTLWGILFCAAPESMQENLALLSESMASNSEIVFFLLAAMTIVELIDSHNGFSLISNFGQSLSKKRLVWTLSFLAFFMSAVLDNLTTTLVMASILKRLVSNKEDRWLVGGIIVISANAGGAWTPIGDVTTTMLWIKGHVTTGAIMYTLFVPSLVAMITAVFLQTRKMEGEFEQPDFSLTPRKVELGGKRILCLGIASFIFVPIFKMVTHLPAYMGILVGLSILWIFTDCLRRLDRSKSLTVPYALTKIDSSSLLFFLGILLAIGALEHSKILESAAMLLDYHIGNHTVIAATIGVISAVIDNVPLVAASMSMYSLEQFPPDHSLWDMIAYCAGTGGSIFIIGSAAGIALMSIEHVPFIWYMKRLSLTAAISFFAGLGAYLLIF